MLLLSSFKFLFTCKRVESKSLCADRCNFVLSVSVTVM